MRIVHLCLSCFYVDNCAYQENQLVAQHVRDGHDVIVIASSEVIDDKGYINYVPTRSYLGSDGAQVHRLPYRHWLPEKVARKIRIYKGTQQHLSDFKPEVILFHGACAMELLVIAKYVRRNSKVAWYIDCHEDFNNSARNFVSKWLLHGLIYRITLRSVLPMVRKVLCITPESMDFMHQFYGIKSEKIEFFPLGGDVYEDNAYNKVRAAERYARGISDTTCLFIQSGKMDTSKKVENTLRAFRQIPGDHVRLILAGKLMSDVESEIQALIEADPRVSFVGWVNPVSLKALLCAADVYVQPGSQSATMQMSLCCRCAVVLDDVPSHQIYHDGNGYLVQNETQLAAALQNIAQNSREVLNTMQNHSRDMAARWLDYRKLARRILC